MRLQENPLLEGKNGEPLMQKAKLHGTESELKRRKIREAKHKASKKICALAKS